jgi:hypothetical protein
MEDTRLGLGKIASLGKGGPDVLMYRSVQVYVHEAVVHVDNALE